MSGGTSAVDDANGYTPWLCGAAHAIEDEITADDLQRSLAALERLEEDRELWRALKKAQVPWERVRVAEAQWRAHAVEAIACARHGQLDLPEEWRPEMLRPPWTADLPSRVWQGWVDADAQMRVDSETQLQVDDVAIEVLCSVDCQPGLCDLGLCWHCWHLAESGRRPEEIGVLLGHMRAHALASAPGTRARLVEHHWAPLALLAEAAGTAVQQVAASTARSVPLVLVLGGCGVSAVAAARVGAEVLWLESNEVLAETAKVTLARNGVESKASVLRDLSEQHVEQLSHADVVVLENFNADGVLGSGAVARWCSIATQLHAAWSGGKAPQVCPSRLDFRAALAKTRLDRPAGFDFDLGPYAEYYGGHAPLPRALPMHSTAIVPTTLSEDVAACSFDLAGCSSGSAAMEGQALLRLCITAAGRADSILVTCHGLLPGTMCEHSAWGKSVYNLVAPIDVNVGDVVEIRCSWTVHRLWFELEAARSCVPPLAKVHLLDWYSEMMNDLPRNSAYAAAIAEAITGAKREGKKCRVVDIGCGAGFLSLLARQAGADEVLGIEITPHLARCAGRVHAANRNIEPASSEAACARSENGKSVTSVVAADVRSLDRDESERCDLAISELLDSSGFGERLVPIIRHAKSHLLCKDGEIIPRRLHLSAALVDLHLPPIAEVDLQALEPFWCPARAAQGEWMAVDLDDGPQWTLVSDPVQVFSIDFNQDQRSIATSLCERELAFSLNLQGAVESRPSRCNAIVWWFEAEVGAAGAPPLTNAPAILRKTGAGATHWAQAMASLGPWALGDLPEDSEVCLHVRTDGATFKWTPLGIRSGCASDIPMEGSRLAGLAPFTEATSASVSSAVVGTWRQAMAEPMQAVRDLRDRLERVGDIARLQALQAAILHISAQPGLFAVEASSDAVTPFLKDFFA